MKKVILFCCTFILFNATLFGQNNNPTLKETVKYINDNLKWFYPLNANIEISNDGAFKFTDHPESHTNGDFKKIVIGETQKATGEREIGKYKIVLSCKTENCLQSFWTYEGAERAKPDSNIFIYFNDMEVAEKVRKALLHAQKLVMQNKDLFSK